MPGHVRRTADTAVLAAACARIREAHGARYKSEMARKIGISADSWTRYESEAKILIASDLAIISAEHDRLGFGKLDITVRQNARQTGRPIDEVRRWATFLATDCDPVVRGIGRRIMTETSEEIRAMIPKLRATGDLVFCEIAATVEKIFRGQRCFSPVAQSSGASWRGNSRMNGAGRRRGDPWQPRRGRAAPQPSTTAVSEALKRLIEATGMAQKHLATEGGISESSFHTYIKGMVNPTNGRLVLVKKLLAAHNITLEESTHDNA